MAQDKKDDRVTKRRVVCRSVSADPATGEAISTEIVDYVRPNFDGEPEDSTGFLDAYVADARTRWQSVIVSDEPDAGPAGYDGDTNVPTHLVGKQAGDFARYGTAATPENALDEAQGTGTPQAGGGGMALGAVATTLARLGLSLNLMFLLAAILSSFQLLIQTVTQRNTLAGAYAGAATYMALYSTVPGATAGTELTGGTPAYARIATAWSAAANSATSTGPHAFNVASGATVAGGGFHTAVTAGTYLDGGSFTSQAFASQGTYSASATYTQS